MAMGMLLRSRLLSLVRFVVVAVAAGAAGVIASVWSSAVDN